MNRISRILLITAIFLLAVTLVAQISIYLINKEIAETKRQMELQKYQSLILKIIQLESSGRHDGCWGDNYTSYGICQWRERSFNYWKNKMRMPWLEWKDRSHQIELMDLVIRAGQGHEWSVFKKAYKTVYKTDAPKRGVRINV